MGTVFLVESDSQKNVIPPTTADSLTAGHGPQLIADNGSPIATYGERLVTASFHGWEFKWNFVVDASSVPILGADFLAHGLLVDFAHRRLVDALSFFLLPCFTRGTNPLIWANLVAPGDVFQRLLCFGHCQLLISAARQRNKGLSIISHGRSRCLRTCVASTLRSCLLPGRSSRPWSAWALCSTRTVPGPLPFTWCPSRTSGGDRAGIFDV